MLQTSDTQPINNPNNASERKINRYTSGVCHWGKGMGKACGELSGVVSSKQVS